MTYNCIVLLYVYLKYDNNNSEKDIFRFTLAFYVDNQKYEETRKRNFF